MIKNVLFVFLMFFVVSIITSCCCGNEFKSGWESGLAIEEANQLYVDGKYQEAIQKYQESIELASSAEAYYKIGLSYEKLDDKKEALKYFKKAADWIEMNPSSVDEFMIPDLKEKVSDKIKELSENT